MIRISTLFFILAMIGFMGFVYMHEAVHREIYYSYGIENVEIDLIHHFPNAVTIPHNVTKGQCPGECHLAHNLNEVVGYPLMIFYALFIIFFYAVLLQMEDRK